MIELSLDAADLTRMEQSLVRLYRNQLPFAVSRALNDCAKAATVAVNRAMPDVFDRPTKFTDRASIAPRALAATKTRPIAEVTLRPIQAQYLRLEETGGTRTGAMNTRKPSAALTLPGKAQQRDAFGNIPAGTLPRLTQLLQQAAQKKMALRHAAKAAAGKHVRKVAARDRGVFYVPRNAARPGLAGGFWQRLPGHRITHLISFKEETAYHGRMNYHARVEAAARATWPKAMLLRLHEAIRTVR